MTRARKVIIWILMGVFWWACIVLIFCLGGCGMGYSATSQPGPAWAAAWGCRCDSCCAELDRLDAESARVNLEGVGE